MALTVGSRLGHYDVTALIGEGGMGQVYQATDTKLGRQVALKILPEPFATDPDRLARFQREAQVLASLNHPGIAAIYGLEESDGVRALVLELVEGPTLADRIAQGPIPVDEALPIAKQIAEALEAAHEAGVIHRDLKPANIKVREDGTVKVLDFGLAKALDPNPTGDPSQSPTLTAAATQMGVIMGTAAYMSPEQARGKAVDKRADIWSFGAVLFEMLTGRRVFNGDTVSDTLADVMKSDPKWDSLSEDLPATLMNLIRRCLEKDPRQRIRDIGDVRLAMEGAFGATVETVSLTIPTRSIWQRPVVVAVLVLGASLVTGLVVRAPNETTPRDSPVRFTLPVPDGYETTVSSEVPSLAVSPDGRKVVYREGGMLVQRLLDEEQSRPIPGTEGAELPFFSPDGEWLGFLQETAFRRISSEGVSTGMGDAHVDWAHGAHWGADDRVVYGRNRLGIWRMSIPGGEPEQITDPSERADERGHTWPQSLNSGSLLLFSAIGPSGNWYDSKIILLDLGSGERSVVVEDGSYGRYVSTGHVIYSTEDGNIQAIPYDLETREAGASFPVESGVLLGQFGGGASFAVSPAGTLAFVRGDVGGRHLLYWYDRSGQPISQLGGVMTAAWGLEIDPAGDRIATTLPNSRNHDIYLLEDGRVSPQRLTTSPESDGWPVWSPDGTRIAWAGVLDDKEVVLVRSIDSDEAPSEVHRDPGGVWPRSWSPDGRWIAISVRTQDRGLDIVAVDVENPGTVVAISDGPSEEWDAQFSPDGSWVAYDSDETGPRQIYVQTFPPSVAPVQVSRGVKGQHPRWSPTSQELYFWQETTLMAARYTTDPRFAVLDVRPLFAVPDYIISDDPYYTVSPDGERFLIQVHNPAAVPREITVVLHWFEDLKTSEPTN